MAEITSGNWPKHSASFGSGEGEGRSVTVYAKVKNATEQLTTTMFDGNYANSPDYFNGYNFHYFAWSNTYHRISRGWGNGNVWLTDQVAGTAVANNYYTLESRWCGKTSDSTTTGILKGFVNGVEKLSAVNSEYSSRSYLGFNSWDTARWLIDRVFVRKCASVEPAVEISGTFERPSNPASTPATLTTTFEYDDYNKLTEITFPDSTTEALSYDDNGQLVKSEKSTGETTNYEWNDQGMLVKVILPNGEPVEYEYDGNQRLISRKSSDGVDNFVQSGWDIVTKMDDVGKRTYYTGSSAVESEDSVKYFHYNHRGDTVLVTDANGEILHNLNYEAYGKPTNTEGIPVNNLSIKNIPNLFVGGSGIRYDTKTDLLYMRFRWFSASQLRFISTDLLMDLNRYAYVKGNPISFIDPLGLLEEASIVYIKNGRPVTINISVASRWRTREDIFGNIYKYPLQIFNYQEGLLAKYYEAGAMDVSAVPSPDAIYKEKANRRKYGLVSLRKWPGYKGAGIEDRETQNCRMFSIGAFIAGDMQPEAAKRFINDNYEVIENPTPDNIKPGYIISYGENFGHAAIVYGRGRGKDIIIFERDADYDVYIGTFEASKSFWKSPSKVWKPKDEKKKFYYDIKGKNLWETGTFTPFEALTRYCKIGKNNTNLINWYYGVR